MVDIKNNDVFCDLKSGCWNEPCDKINCTWNINKEEYGNCFLFYKYFIKDKPHTLYEIGKILRISHATVKQIESEALQKLKENVNLYENL